MINFHYYDQLSVRTAFRHFRATNNKAALLEPSLVFVHAPGTGHDSQMSGPEWLLTVFRELRRLQRAGHPATIGSLLQQTFKMYEPASVEALWRLQGEAGVRDLARLVGKRVGLGEVWR